MTRAYLDYTVRREAAPVAGFNPDVPIVGHYRMKMRSGGVFVGVRVWFGAPTDPDTGEELDRSHRWQATENGRPVDLERVWPRCAEDQITESEAAHLIAVEAWAKQNAPNSALANPKRRIDLLTEVLPEW
ncbi:hypothetical protein [Sphingomonas sp. HMP6]|uniref:hypothetical protein n=1 Tax=Sphingomonas sp. HMP6 TaxID=1517551 RepID=UPI001596EABE|nr:hypothetical protein [Sphingomonas sp. HMP6]BCA57725.1 hypothetical protein HMP06_0494 [Sphingomonas sp. HMP6]